MFYEITIFIERQKGLQYFLQITTLPTLTKNWIKFRVLFFTATQKSKI